MSVPECVLCVVSVHECICECVGMWGCCKCGVCVVCDVCVLSVSVYMSCMYYVYKCVCVCVCMCCVYVGVL